MVICFDHSAAHAALCSSTNRFAASRGLELSHPETRFTSSLAFFATASLSLPLYRAEYSSIVVVSFCFTAMRLILRAGSVCDPEARPVFTHKERQMLITVPLDPTLYTFPFTEFPSGIRTGYRSSTSPSKSGVNTARTQPTFGLARETIMVIEPSSFFLPARQVALVVRMPVFMSKTCL